MKKLLPLFIIFFAFSLRASANGGCAFTAHVDSLNNLLVDFTYIGWPGPATYNYDFGDGVGTSTLQNPSYLYSAPGNYTVTLNMADTNSFTCTYTVTVVVGSNVYCNFMHSGGGAAPATVSFINTSSGTIASYQWDFGDGSPFDTQQNPSHTYTVPGIYNVCLTTQDSLGLSCTICQNVTIMQGCIAAFQTVSTGLDVTFIENSLNTNLGSMNYFWEFADGDTSTSHYPTHTYALSASYHACLTISNGSTCWDSVCHIIFVDSVPPSGCSANFVFTQSQAYAVDIVNASYGASPMFYSWDFGDGNTSSLPYPIHTYTTTGSYVICLTVTDSSGCTSTFCDSLNMDSLGNMSTRTVSGFSINVVSPGSISTSVPQIENSELAIYPNPSQHFFVVDVKDNSIQCEYKLYSITGNISKRGRLNSGKNIIDINNLANGMYFLETANNRGEKRSFKIIKQ